MAAKKSKRNSLVGNINKRKKAGKSRPKSRSHVSKESYAEMEAGWPRSKKAKKAKAAKKTRAKKVVKRSAKKTGRKGAKKNAKKRA